MTHFTRRKLVKIGLAAGAGFAVTRCASSNQASAPVGTPNNPATGPVVNTNQIKDVTLRLIGTGVSQINEIRDQSTERSGF